MNFSKFACPLSIPTINKIKTTLLTFHYFALRTKPLSSWDLLQWWYNTLNVEKKGTGVTA